jgi:CDGSH-type Zn-finger protein
VRIRLILTEGVEVRRVMVNGSMHEAYLSLSSDRFTLHLTNTKRGSLVVAVSTVVVVAWEDLSLVVCGESHRRWYSQGEHRQHHFPSPSVSSAAQFDLEEQSIDIGAIARIQRGQVTHKFELAK